MKISKASKISFDTIVFTLAIIWFLLTAYFSNGYHHDDEHYQIIEFANYKQGKISSADLAWEFEAKIRPTVQPSVCYVVIRVCHSLSIHSPFNQALVLRILTAILALFSIRFFSCSCKSFISDKYWKIFLLLSYFLWFLPFINVRFSSETWSGLSFLVAIGVLLRGYNKNYIFMIVGGLLGLSFLLRYQMAISAFGLILWLIFIAKENFKHILQILIGGCIALFLGLLIDYWFYGSIEIPPFNYFLVNLLEGKASEFGVSPWYEYIYYMFRFSFFPLGIVLLLSLIMVIILKPRTVFIWIILPFIIIHSFIAHKEIRFLFPIVYYAPVIIILAIQEINLNGKKNAVKSIKILGFLLVMINLTALIVASLKPAGVGRVSMVNKIEKLNVPSPIFLTSKESGNPYDPSGYLTAHFYQSREMHFKWLDGIRRHTSLAEDKAMQNFLVVKKKNLLDNDVQDFIREKDLVVKAQSIPKFFEPFLKIYGYKNYDIIVLYGNNR